MPDTCKALIMGDAIYPYRPPLLKHPRLRSKPLNPYRPPLLKHPRLRSKPLNAL